jgi:RimJ/RimL family protein N-acetyltransferase
MWCVRLREGAAWIGTAGVKPRRGHEDQLELKYNLVRSAWGRGLGTEAARAALELAGVSDVVAVIDPDNHRSQRVATKLAFRLAQTLVDDGRPTELWRRP